MGEDCQVVNDFGGQKSGENPLELDLVDILDGAGAAMPGAGLR